jgi:probable rRNA maturation factor
MTSSDKPPSRSSTSSSTNSSSSNTIDLRASGISDEEVPDDLSRVAAAALEYMGRSGVEVSILLCGDTEIHELNRLHRNQDKPTDVLSFPLSSAASEDAEGAPVPAWPDEPGKRIHLGDIAISVDSVRRNAEEWEIAYTQELQRVAIHGVLHLLGMDHTTNEPDQEMLQLQERILETVTKDGEP